uniref:Putative conserved plasma membrane protein n=1 Tax=Corethrella appendiculata TaxID=1370023 RepID=U5EFQ6_9DIPT
MALHQKKSSEIPADAVKLDEIGAINYFYDLIVNWDNSRDVWPLRFAGPILGISTTVTSLYVNSHYRVKLKLGSYGRLSSYLPIVVLPSIMSIVSHSGFIQPRVILQKDPCTVCTQMRAATFHSFFAVAYPTLLAPIASFLFATRHFTYRMPEITSEPKQVFKLWQKISRPLTFQLTCFLAVNAFLAMFLTHKEYESVYTINAKLLQMEKAFDARKLQR